VLGRNHPAQKTRNSNAGSHAKRDQPHCRNLWACISRFLLKSLGHTLKCKHGVQGEIVTTASDSESLAALQKEILKTSSGGNVNGAHISTGQFFGRQGPRAPRIQTIISASGTLEPAKTENNVLVVAAISPPRGRARRFQIFAGYSVAPAAFCRITREDRYRHPRTHRDGTEEYRWRGIADCFDWRW
jgi:hypothetical protein